MRLDQNSPECEISPTEEQCLKIVENETVAPLHICSPDTVDVIDSSQLPNENFAKSGITITDDEISVDISSATGLRKTDFSEQMYSDNAPKKNVVSKIPRSPMPVRRKSVDNLCMIETDTPLSRKIPQYRSVRKPTASSMAKEVATKENTWSGRTTKRRPSLTNDTYQPSNSKPNSPSPNRRNISNRPAVQYDQNGRRIKPISASANTSPIKNRIASPLAQQFLEVAGEAKDDAQFIEKMKALLAQYTKKTGNNKYDDFTTAWVNSNGNIDHTDASPKKTLVSQKASTESSSEASHPREVPTVINSRRSGGLSRIPAPVRSNTGMY